MEMPLRGRLLAAAAAGALIAASGGVGATPLNPNDFTSLGALPMGSFTLDTGASGGGVIVSQGMGLPDIAVFTYDGGSVLGAGQTITATGPNLLAILFKGSATISGTIDVSGANGASGPAAAGVQADGVAGGGAGGKGHGNNGFIAGSNGGGLGGGLLGAASGSNSNYDGGSGGGFGTNGGNSGVVITFRMGGAAYGDPLSDVLYAGSGGGGGGGCCNVNPQNGGGGGAGGGGVEIGALTLLDLDGATLLSNGGDGGRDEVEGGGGSGGAFLLHAFTVDIDATTLIQANGGSVDGGPHGGGCGGAGRIEILYNTAGSLTNSGSVEALGGGIACNSGDLVTMASANIGEALAMPPTAGIAEPGTMALFGLGLAGLGFVRRRRIA